MLKHSRPPVLFAIAFLSSSLVINNDTPALAQERQGCFMVDEAGQLIDLSSMCPVAPQFAGQNLGTGDIQVTLRWTTTDDLDLAVMDPSGQTVDYINRNIPSRGQLDVDANAACTGSTRSPIENIFWPPSEAPQGPYNIIINLYSRCSGSPSGPIPFNLTLLVQGNTQTLTGVVDEQNPVATFPFSLPLGAGN